MDVYCVARVPAGRDPGDLFKHLVDKHYDFFITKDVAAISKWKEGNTDIAVARNEPLFIPQIKIENVDVDQFEEVNPNLGLRRGALSPQMNQIEADFSPNGSLNGEEEVEEMGHILEMEKDAEKNQAEQTQQIKKKGQKKQEPKKDAAKDPNRTWCEDCQRSVVRSYFLAHRERMHKKLEKKINQKEKAAKKLEKAAKKKENNKEKMSQDEPREIVPLPVEAFVNQVNGEAIDGVMQENDEPADVVPPNGAPDDSAVGELLAAELLFNPEIENVNLDQFEVNGGAADAVMQENVEHVDVGALLDLIFARNADDQEKTNQEEKAAKKYGKSCGGCGKSFTGGRAYRKHIRAFRERPHFFCEPCNKSFPMAASAKHRACRATGTREI